MKYFKPSDERAEYITVRLTSATTSSNIGTSSSKSDTNVQTAILVRAELEDMIKNHRPKSEKEIRAEGENRIRFISMIFIFIVVISIFAIVVYFGVVDRKLPDFANNLMALMTTLVGGIGGFIYGTKK